MEPRHRLDWPVPPRCLLQSGSTRQAMKRTAPKVREPALDDGGSPFGLPYVDSVFSALQNPFEFAAPRGPPCQRPHPLRSDLALAESEEPYRMPRLPPLRMCEADNRQANEPVREGERSILP